MTIHLQTPRLILRQWQDSDTAPFIQMCADDEVMRYFPKKLDATEATAFIERIRTAIETRGWGLFAVELKATGEFIGFIGLHVHPSEFEIADAPEIGLEKVGEFDHPLVPADHILCRHVLYEKQRSDYLYIPFC